MSDFSDLTFESVFVSSDAPLKPHNFYNTENQASKPAKSRSDLESFLKKTPLMILEEGANGVYQMTPQWNSAEITTTAGLEFEMTLSLRGITVKARANSKKIAKQKAAVKYLHELVNKGKHEEFFIPGDTAEAAHANIKQIFEKTDEPKQAAILSLQEADESIRTAKEFPDPVLAGSNWVGMLQEKAQKNKLGGPEYEDCKLEQGNCFMVTCRMCKQQTRGIKSTKKAAKSLAAWLMMKCLEDGVESMQRKYEMTEEFEEMDEDENLSNIQKETSSFKDNKSALIDILSDKKRFSKYTMEFKFPSISTLRVHQVLLEVQIFRPVLTDSDELKIGAEHTQTDEILKVTVEKEREQKKNASDSGPKVFAGQGSSEEEAIQSACKSAIIHFNTFNFNN